MFCAYHNDTYPGGDPKTGGIADKSLLRGRAIGSDFSGKSGWSMYHGSDVPGFPQHPHYGFETVSIVKEGLVDHSDSLGCGGRFGNGDVQWMTAGDGVQHSELFPLLHPEKNPLNFMQLWLNLPARSKRVAPHYSMLWDEDLTRAAAADNTPHIMTVSDPTKIPSKGDPLSPPPHSWAADPENHVVILRMELGAGKTHVFEPLAMKDREEITRSLYLINGEADVNGKTESARTGFEIAPSGKVEVRAGSNALLLYLQGRKIAEPSYHQGPFYGNGRADLADAMQRYYKTQFGGWPWPSDTMVHSLKAGRFAKYADGTKEER